MAKKAKKGNGKAKVAAKPGQPKQNAPKAKEAHKSQALDLNAGTPHNPELRIMTQ